MEGLWLTRGNHGGAGAETFAYDALGRVTAHDSDLGSFALGYLGQTGQIASRALAGQNIKTGTRT